MRAVVILTAVGSSFAALQPNIPSAAVDHSNDSDDISDEELFNDLTSYERSTQYNVKTPPDHDGFAKAPTGPKADWTHLDPASCGADAVPDGSPSWIRRERPQWPIDDKAWQNDTLIHVNIAAFRDGPRCAQTLMLMLKHAEYPDRVRVAVLDQYTHLDPLCEDGFKVAVKLLCEDVTDEKERDMCELRKMRQISYSYLPAEQSSGPVTARAMAQQLQYQSRNPPDSQEFCMLLDAHMKFKQNWDTVLMMDWALVGNENAVLSTYVPDHVDKYFANLSEPLEKWSAGARIHDFKINDNGIPRIHTGTQLKPCRTLLSTVWGAGLSFSRCHFNHAVPFDPHLHGVFDGEEMSVAFRGFTHGYDIYTNANQVIAHEYTQRTYPKPAAGAAWWRNDNGKHADGKASKRDYAKKRLAGLFLLPVGDDIGPTEKHFHIGDIRSRQSFNDLMKFDPQNNASKKELPQFKDAHTSWIPPAVNPLTPQQSYTFPPLPRWQTAKPDQEVQPIYPGWPWEGLHTDSVSSQQCFNFLSEVGRSLITFNYQATKQSFEQNGQEHCKAMVMGYVHGAADMVWGWYRKFQFFMRFGFTNEGGDLPGVDNIVVGICSDKPGKVLETALGTWAKRLPINLVAVPNFDGNNHNGTVTEATVGEETYNRLDVTQYPSESNAHGNIFVLLKHLYEMHSKSGWYLIGYEDTVFAPGSVQKYTEMHSPNFPLMRGKCVSLNHESQKINFAVGGSGFLLSGKLVWMLQPVLDKCREKYAKVSYPDAKLGACIEEDLGLREQDFFCSSKDGVTFNNQHQAEFLERQNVQGDMADNLIVAIQEPVPAKMTDLNNFFDAVDRAEKKLTWETAKENWLQLNFVDAFSNILPKFLQGSEL